MIKIQSIKDADKKLEIIKNKNENIKRIYEFYCAKYPNEKKETIVNMLAEKLNLKRTRVWEIVTEGVPQGTSIYKKSGIKFL